MIVALVPCKGAPAARLAVLEARAVGDAVEHGRGEDGREVLGATETARVVDAAEAEEGLVGVGDLVDGVVGGGTCA